MSGSAIESTLRAQGRGAQRRRAILEATLRLLRARGPGGVTHRAVAREADVPLAATTYYFASKDDLLEQALELLAEQEIERLRALAGEVAAQRPPDPVEFARTGAAMLAVALRAEFDGMLPKFELYMEAARRPSLRAVARRWIDAFGGLAEEVLRGAGAREPEQAARILVATVDGLMVQRLATSGDPPEERELRARLERMVLGLLRD